MQTNLIICHPSRGPRVHTFLEKYQTILLIVYLLEHVKFSVQLDIWLSRLDTRVLLLLSVGGGGVDIIIMIKKNIILG